MVISLLLAQAQLERLASTPFAYADEIQLPPSYVMGHEASIKYWASKYNAPADRMEAVIKCESDFIPQQSNYKSATGPNGREDSWGVAQIYLPKHPTITRDMAMDPDFSVQYMASHWHTDHWSCAKLLGFSDG